jgi:hypothetical protein
VLRSVPMGEKVITRVFAVLMGLVIVVGAAAGCSSKSSGSASSAASASAPASSSTASASAAGASPAVCASAGTRKIPKTRLLTDLGLTYGAFHRYLYKPYKAGSFTKGADGRTKALIKAGLASAAIVKLLSNAVKNAAADPTLCKYVPTMSNISAQLTDLTSKIKHGTVSDSDLDGTNGLFDQLKNNAGFTPPANASLPGLS